MNTVKLILFPFLVLFLLTSIAIAQEDFTASSSPSVELCPCSNQAYPVTVENTGTVASTYTLFAGGDASEWVSFQPDKFTLNLGERGSFFVFVDSVCNIEESYGLDIFIATSNGLTKVVRNELQFNQCYDYSLEQGVVIEEAEESASFLQHDGSYSLCTNEKKSIPVLITNNEDYQNRYRIFLDAPEWVQLSVDSVSLEGKKSGLFLIDFDTADILGDFDFKLSVVSELGKLQRKSNIEVDVQDCYALDVNLEKEEDVVCNGEDKSYDINIKNKGTLSQIVELEVDGPTWVEIDNNHLNLHVDEENLVKLNINPLGEVAGNFVISVNALLEDKTELKFSDSINIGVVEKSACYQASIHSESIVNNFYKEDFFSVRVTNIGIKKTDYKVSLEGPFWVSISPKKLELNPGQTGNLNVKVNPSDDAEIGEYDIKINLEADNGAVYFKNINLNLKKENEFVKQLKSILKLYQYYIYLAIALIVLFTIFKKSIIRTKDRSIRRYRKYLTKQERKRALSLARREREEEKRKEKKVLEETKKEAKKKVKVKWKNPKEKLYYLAGLVIGLIFLGHYYRLYSLKYIHIYLRNFFYGNLYYILMGIGTVLILFFLVLVFNKITGNKPKKKIKQKEKWYNNTNYVLAVFVPILILVTILAYFNLFDDLNDFVVLYSNYFGLGIVILFIIFIGLRFYRPMRKFLKE